METPEGFEWDADKNWHNIEKHGIDFEDVVEVFYGLHVVRPSDRRGEQRWIAIGETKKRTIAVVFTRRGDQIRIISARRARTNEKRTNRKETMGRSPQGKD